jgi:N-acetylated-alpha-linked acidic dipeptidase
MKEIPLHFLPVEEQRRKGNFRYLKAFLLFAGIYTLSSFFSISKPSQPTHRLYDEHPIEGMSASERESLFLSIPFSFSAHATAKKFASKPHVAGSDQDFEDAKEMLKLFQRELGASDPPAPPHFPPEELPIYDAGTPRSRSATISLTSRLGPRKPTAWIDVYYPDFDTPAERSLDILNDQGMSEVSFDLVENGDPLDEDAAKYHDSVPAWHGLSGHGEAEGELVYVNYGTYEDFEELTEQGVNFTGKIVVARYGAIYRGLKVRSFSFSCVDLFSSGSIQVKRAEELNAAGILIYSDPRDDGYVTTANGFTPYPHGPARNPSSFQRGSVMYGTYPGDPTTPGRPAYPNAQRDEAQNIPKIPSLPVSWANAQRLLEEIGEVYTAEGKLNGRISGKKGRMVNHGELVHFVWFRTRTDTLHSQEICHSDLEHNGGDTWSC